GLFCAGTIADCVPDGGLQPTNCFCTGTRWSCREPSWCEVDAGSEDGGADADANLCPAEIPSSAISCMPGVDCVYPWAPCPVHCVCDGFGSFRCDLDCSADAGNSDATGQ
ncbi:MAG: hypothetical protein WCJ30_09275, partial [Deltaproteobacteria bacterium]